MKAIREWCFGSLLPLVCTILVLPLLALIGLVFLVIEAIDRCRRHCPIHHTPFQYEVIVVSPKEAEANEELKRGQRALTASWSLDYLEWKRKRFPYASTDHFIKSGTHRRRYCPACREGERSHTFADYENDPELSFGLDRHADLAVVDRHAERELRDLEWKLGIFREDEE